MFIKMYTFWTYTLAKEFSNLVKCLLDLCSLYKYFTCILDKYFFLRNAMY